MREVTRDFIGWVIIGWLFVGGAALVDRALTGLAVVAPFVLHAGTEALVTIFDLPRMLVELLGPVLLLGLCVSVLVTGHSPVLAAATAFAGGWFLRSTL
jgi:hypothetical protein